MSRDFDSRRAMRNLLPEFEPHTPPVSPLHKRRRALRLAAADQRPRALDIPGAFLAAETERNS